MRVLLVEDEPRLLRSLAKGLREEGYAVDTAEDGDDGLFKAETYNYDAIVLDVMLPVMDGWTLLERLRKSKPTPVLMLTARDTIKDRVRGLDTGAEGLAISKTIIDLHNGRIEVQSELGLGTKFTICLPQE
jgi:two-component system, OmpR family, response regulator